MVTLPSLMPRVPRRRKVVPTSTGRQRSPERTTAAGCTGQPSESGRGSASPGAASPWHRETRVDLAIEDSLVRLVVDDFHVARVATRSRAGENQEQPQPTSDRECLRENVCASTAQMIHVRFDPAGTYAVADNQCPHARCQGSRHAVSSVRADRTLPGRIADKPIQAKTAAAGAPAAP